MERDGARTIRGMVTKAAASSRTVRGTVTSKTHFKYFLWSCLTDAVRRHFLWSWLTDAVRRRAASLARPISRYCLWSCLTDAVRRRAASLARPISRYCAVVSIAKTISCPLLPCFLLRVYQPSSKRGGL